MATTASHATRVALAGSHRRVVRDARAVRDSPANERLEVTIVLRPKATPPRESAALRATKPPHQRQYATVEQWTERHGSNPADIAVVKNFAERHHLTVVDINQAHRTVTLAGTVRNFSEAFGVILRQYEHPHGSYRGREGPITLPSEVAEVVRGVFGLDNRPIAKPHFQYRRAAQGVIGSIAAAARTASAGPQPLTPVQVATAYNYPISRLDGCGRRIAILEFGGGYRPCDISTYFASIGLPEPTIETRSVDGAGNQPSTADTADGEVMLDIEVAAAVAPAANIVMYFAPNTDKGFLDAVNTAVHDAPDVISVSWGAAEANWTDQAMDAMNDAFRAAAELGVTVCVSAGDNGSSDGEPDTRPHVDFPASSPYVLACGGTQLIVQQDGTRSNDTAWNDDPQSSATGGGISSPFNMPDYQVEAKIPSSEKRGVPDIAGDADPNSGYRIRVDGQDTVVGGTSAVAPLMAGLVALLNQDVGGRVGFINPVLYSQPVSTKAVWDVLNGDNGAFKAGPGWDRCSGLGVVNGNALLDALNSGAGAAATD